MFLSYLSPFGSVRLPKSSLSSDRVDLAEITDFHDSVAI
jgi:hypothetical protein